LEEDSAIILWISSSTEADDAAVATTAFLAALATLLPIGCLDVMEMEAGDESSSLALLASFRVSRVSFYFVTSLNLHEEMHIGELFLSFSSRNILTACFNQDKQTNINMKCRLSCLHDNSLGKKSFLENLLSYVIRLSCLHYMQVISF
jgi:hypothetical protein